MKGLRKGLLLFLVLLITVTSVPLAAADLAKQQAEYERIQKEMGQIEQKINANKKQANSVSGQIEQLDKDIQRAEEQLEQLETRLKNTDLEIGVIEKDLEDAIERLSFRQEMLKRRLRALYERGSVSYLEVLLNARSFSDFINRIGLLQRVVTQDAGVVDSIKIEKASIEEQQQILQNKRRELATLEQQTRTRGTELASRKAERSRYRDQLMSDSAEWQQSLKALEQVEKELERLIAEAQAKNPGSGGGTGAYTWPTPGYTKINSPFGYRKDPIFGGTSFHAGIDIGAPMGAKIVAADGGTVLFSGWMTGYGQVVILDHGKGISTLYAHASVLMVQNNQKVIKGQQVAKVGSTGWSTGPHLHFEYRINGEKQNPLNYVKRP